MPFVYILKTKSDKYYVGSTVDMAKRLLHHKGGYTPSTKRLKFDGCLLVQEYKTLSDARKVEMKIKRLKSKKYIDKMVLEGFIKIKP